MAAFEQEVNKHVENGSGKTIPLPYRGFRRSDYPSSMNQTTIRKMQKHRLQTITLIKELSCKCSIMKIIYIFVLQTNDMMPKLCAHHFTTDNICQHDIKWRIVKKFCELIPDLLVEDGSVVKSTNRCILKNKCYCSKLHYIQSRGTGGSVSWHLLGWASL